MSTALATAPAPSVLSPEPTTPHAATAIRTPSLREGAGGGFAGASNFPSSAVAQSAPPAPSSTPCSSFSDSSFPLTDFAPSSGVPRVPLSPDDSELLDRFLSEDIDLDLHQLSRATKRTVPDLAAWVLLPHIAAIIDAFLHVRRLCQINRDMDKREQALNGLCDVLAVAANIVETRRAACAILRAIDNANRAPRLRRSSSSGGGGGGGSGGGSGGAQVPPIASSSTRSVSSTDKAPSRAPAPSVALVPSVLSDLSNPPIPSTAPDSDSTLKTQNSKLSAPLYDPSGVGPSRQPTGGDARSQSDLALPPAVHSQPAGLPDPIPNFPANSPSALPLPSPRSLRAGFAGLPPATSTPASIVSASGAATSRGAPAATSWP